MVVPTRPPANGFVRLVRHIYNPIGFSKGYNFLLFFVFNGALMGFILARLSYIDIYHIFCSKVTGGQAIPGECFYYYTIPYERIGIILHLGCVLPAGFLAFFQFVPAIRHNYIIVHRVFGYLALLLSLLGTVGALMITGHAFGGDMSIRYSCGLLSIIFLVAIFMAYINIKRLQIEEHRAWMLRAWAYAGSIITMRLIMLAGVTSIASIGVQYTVWACDKLDFLAANQTDLLTRYPGCEPWVTGANPDQHVVVDTLMTGHPENVTAALSIHFGSALWLAMVIHAVVAEIYLKLTPAETERLRKVSYQRQLEAGMKNPGRAGLTADRFWDGPKWTPNNGNDAITPAESKDQTYADYNNKTGSATVSEH